MAEDPTGLFVAPDGYHIERELGRGGMATVYLARDLKHSREVAIKVLRPELAAALGRERFLREVTTTANLRHPHILPLFDSGKAGEFLFYVMPLVKGESLRDRLLREKQLPIDDALQIAREVADALDYAHTYGVIHRDIKPGNILLENGHAVVADFGIARAVSVAGAEGLTETGLSLGTPLYMSPEQGVGDEIDGRSDQYALGCVLYEMLAGEPPLTARTPQAILARRLMEPVPPLRTVRESVPAHVEQAIDRALSKAPAERFATTKQFADALAEPDESAARRRGTTTRSRPRWPWIIGVAGPLALLLALSVIRFRSPPARLDPNLMAVFPFRIGGTDSSQNALREGMVDFLEVKFSGAGGTRVVPARTALAAWHRSAGAGRKDLTQEDARAVALSLGAGAMVLGTIVATPGHMILSGSLLDTEAGRVRAEAKVEGTPDSLQSLIDGFAAQLAALGAGERVDQLASLTSTSLPALYAYLAGKAAHRAGKFNAAVRHFGRALELDSTFVRAALGYGASTGWVGGSALAKARESAALRFAWSHRDRLSSRERVLLEGYVGRRYPAHTPDPEWLDTWLEVAREIPDDPDVWYKLGDAYFHSGARIGVEQPLRHAAEAFNRALALDTTLNVEPMVHLLQIAGMERDTATARRLVNRLPEHDPSTAVQRLEAGVILGDSSIIVAARRDVDTTGLALQQDALLFGFGMQEAERNAALYLARARPGPDQVPSAFFLFHFYQQLGRPVAAAAAVARLVPKETPAPATGWMFIPALYGYFDTSAGAEIVARLAPVADGPLTRDPRARDDQYGAICGVAWWRLAHGETRTARAAIRRLGDSAVWGCSVMLEALLAAAEHRPDADAAFGRLDTFLLGGRGRPGWITEVARWREAQGDLPGALRAARRCAGYDVILQLAYCRREEGRLAALVGDRAGAINSYSQYLAMRYNPEPSVKPEVDRVRAELAQLVGEPR